VGKKINECYAAQKQHELEVLAKAVRFRRDCEYLRTKDECTGLYS